MNYLRRHSHAIIIVIYSLIFFFVRLIFLDQTFMLHDERDIVFSGLSLARTGADLYGTHFPIQFADINPDNPLISIWFSALGWLIIPTTSVFWARVPFVFFSSLLPILVYMLGKTITRSNSFALAFMFFATINPWMYHLTRYGMDITIALTIVLLAILLHLRQFRLLAYALYVLTSFNYQGFRIAIPFLLMSVEYYLWHSSSKDFKQLMRQFLVHGVFLLFIGLLIVLIDKNISLSRSNQVVFLNQEKFAGIVDEKRRLTTAPLFLSSLFDNKLTESFRYALEGVVNGFNIDLFFFEGDQSATNGTGVSGLLFVTTLPLLLYGVYTLRKHSCSYLFLASFLIWGMTPAVASLNGHSYGIRGSLMIIGYATLITIGYLEIMSKVQNRVLLKRIVLTSFAIALTVDFMTFGYQYYFRRPILLGEMYNQRELTLVKSLQSVGDDKKIVVYDNEPKNLLMSYLFVSQDSMRSVQQQMRLTKNKEYFAGNVVFRDCDVNWESKPVDAVIYMSNRCLVSDEFHQMESRKLPSLHYTDTPLTAFFIIDPHTN